VISVKYPLFVFVLHGTMKHILTFTLCSLMIHYLAANELFARTWNLVKDKEGIKVFTRLEPNSKLKSFKGEATLHAPVTTISKLIMEPGKRDWWEKNFQQTKLLGYQEDKYIRYYLVYVLPWPLTPRDIVTETSVVKDSVTGVHTIITMTVPSDVPEKPEMIRINEYKQKWTLQPLDKETVHVILEGLIDPAGNIPAWLINIVLPETPFKTIQSLREKLLSD
jgi:hypothetical protein